MRELKNVKCQLISILHDEVRPSNEAEVIIKDGGKRIIATVTKQDGLKGLLECDVMIANKIDTQGDFYSNETVEKAQRDFLDYLIETVGKNEPSDTNHNFEVATGVKLVEIWTDKSTDNWIFKAVLDISANEMLMQKAKDGKITGVSIYGKAECIEKSDGLLKSIYEMIKSLFDKSEIKKENDMTKEELQAMTDEQLAELGLQKRETPEAPAEVTETETVEPAIEETPAEPEIEKAEPEIDPKDAEIEALKQKVAELEKSRVSGDLKDAPKEKSIDEIIAEKQNEIRENAKKNNRRITNES